MNFGATHAPMSYPMSGPNQGSCFVPPMNNYQGTHMNQQSIPQFQQQFNKPVPNPQPYVKPTPMGTYSNQRDQQSATPGQNPPIITPVVNIGTTRRNSVINYRIPKKSSVMSTLNQTQHLEQVQEHSENQEDATTQSPKQEQSQTPVEAPAINTVRDPAKDNIRLHHSRFPPKMGQKLLPVHHQVNRPVQVKEPLVAEPQVKEPQVQECEDDPFQRVFTAKERTINQNLRTIRTILATYDIQFRHIHPTQKKTLLPSERIAKEHDVYTTPQIIPTDPFVIHLIQFVADKLRKCKEQIENGETPDVIDLRPHMITPPEDIKDPEANEGIVEDKPLSTPLLTEEEIYARDMNGNKPRDPTLKLDPTARSVPMAYVPGKGMALVHAHSRDVDCVRAGVLGDDRPAGYGMLSGYDIQEHYGTPQVCGAANVDLYGQNIQPEEDLDIDEVVINQGISIFGLMHNQPSSGYTPSIYSARYEEAKFAAQLEAMKQKRQRQQVQQKPDVTRPDSDQVQQCANDETVQKEEIKEHVHQTTQKHHENTEFQHRHNKSWKKKNRHGHQNGYVNNGISNNHNHGAAPSLNAVNRRPWRQNNHGPNNQQ